MTADERDVYDDEDDRWAHCRAPTGYEAFDGGESNMPESGVSYPGDCPDCEHPAEEMGYGVYRCPLCGRHFDDEEMLETFDPSSRHRTRPRRGYTGTGE